MSDTAPAKTTYTAREVAQLLGISESRVRYWAQTGVCGPSERSGSRTVYTFQDLVSVKAAKELLDRGVSLQCARKNLEALRSQCPGLGSPLARLRVRSDGQELVVSEGDTAFEPLSRQLVMDFGLDELAGQLATLQVAPPPPAPDRAASAWAQFAKGGEHESRGEDEAAAAAYAQALALDPALAAAHTNLGNLLYRRGERGQARSHYEAALALDPEQPEARYNLGNLLDDVGESAAARMEWYRVIASCPEFAEAYFNLAVVLARDGEADAARLHLDHYLALVPDDAQATALAQRL